MNDHTFTIDPELESQLVDLGTALAVPAGGRLLEAVRERIELQSPAERSHRPRRYRQLVAAAFVVLALASLVIYGPTRTAIAHWLGIGAVQIQQVDQLPVPPATTAGSTVAPSSVTSALAQARQAMSFPIRVPEARLTGDLRAVETDPNVPGGLVSLTFDRLTLTEIAAQPNQAPVMTKLIGPGTKVQYLTLDGRDAAWITGAPHELGYLAPDGTYRAETLRRAGNVLVWEREGVTYRLEGLNSEADAVAVASSLH